MLCPQTCHLQRALQLPPTLSMPQYRVPCPDSPQGRCAPQGPRHNICSSQCGWLVSDISLLAPETRLSGVQPNSTPPDYAVLTDLRFFSVLRLSKRETHDCILIGLREFGKEFDGLIDYVFDDIDGEIDLAGGQGRRHVWLARKRTAHHDQRDYITSESCAG